MPIKPGIRNFLLIGIMAVMFIVGAKVVLNKYYVKGATEAINAV